MTVAGYFVMTETQSDKVRGHIFIVELLIF